MERAQRIAAKAVRRVLAGAALPAVLAGENDENRRRSRPRARARARHAALSRSGARDRAAARRAAARRRERRGAALGCALPAHSYAARRRMRSSTARYARPRGSSALPRRVSINAILRNFLRRTGCVACRCRARARGALFLPALVDRRASAPSIPERCAAVLDAGNARPPLRLRVNCRAIYAATIMSRRWRAGTSRPHAIGAAGVIARREPRAGRRALPGLCGAAGSRCRTRRAARRAAARCARWHARARRLRRARRQDHASRRACGARPDSRIDIDARSGSNASRENLARLGCRRVLSPADAADPRAWWNGEPFDRILADAPAPPRASCAGTPMSSGCGAESDIAGFVAQQRRLLDALWPDAGARRQAAVCDLLDLPRRERGSDRSASSRAMPTRRAFGTRPAGVVGGRRRATLASGRSAQSTITTGFSTPSSRRTDPPDRAARRRPRHVANEPLPRPVVPDRVCCCCVARRRARDTIPVKSAELRTEDEDVRAQCAVRRASFNPTLEEALQKGVSLYFVLEFELTRPALVLAWTKNSSSNRCSTASPIHR